MDTQQKLDHLGSRIVSRLKPGGTYPVIHPVELNLLAPLSPDELREFAKQHHLNAVRRSGGARIDFTPAAWRK